MDREQFHRYMTSKMGEALNEALVGWPDDPVWKEMRSFLEKRVQLAFISGAAAATVYLEKDSKAR